MADGNRLVPEPTRQLVQRLASMTERGLLEWTEGSAETEFILTRPEGSIVILSVDKDGQHPYRIDVLDPNGVVVEAYDSQDFDADATLLYSLYQAARKSSARASDVVESLLGKLAAEDKADDDIPF